jgi:hypothetical protein
MIAYGYNQFIQPFSVKSSSGWVQPFCDYISNLIKSFKVMLQ